MNRNIKQEPWGTYRRLIEGDPLSPHDFDMIVEIAKLDVGAPLPHGWRVIDGNKFHSDIARVVLRHEIEQENQQ